jgi:hypothetical protein
MRIVAEPHAVDVRSSHQFEQEIGAASSENGLFITKMEFSVRTDTLTIMLKDVTIEQTIKIVLVAKRLQARIIEVKKIIVFLDHEANRQKYGQYELWPAKSDANK